MDPAHGFEFHEDRHVFFTRQEPTSESSAPCLWGWTTWLWMKSRSGEYSWDSGPGLQPGVRPKQSRQEELSACLVFCASERVPGGPC